MTVRSELGSAMPVDMERPWTARKGPWPVEIWEYVRDENGTLTSDALRVSLIHADPGAAWIRLGDVRILGLRLGEAPFCSCRHRSLSAAEPLANDT